MKRAFVGGAALAGISLLFGFSGMLDGNKIDDSFAGTGEAPSVPGAGTTPNLPASAVVPMATVPAATSSYDEAVEAAGIARLQPDPVDAAIGFLELAAHAVRLSPADAAQLQRTITTPANADAIAVETQNRVAALHTAAPAGIRLWIAPLAATMQPLDGGRVDVRVWHVRAIAFGAELITAEWATVIYELEHDGHGWLIRTIDSEPGPTPNPGTRHPDDPAQLLQLVGDWET